MIFTPYRAPTCTHLGSILSSGSTVTSCAVSAKPAHSRGVAKSQMTKTSAAGTTSFYDDLFTNYYQQTCIYILVHACAVCSMRISSVRKTVHTENVDNMPSHAGRLELRSFFLDTPPPLALLCVTVCGPAHIPPGLLMAPPLIPLRLASVAASQWLYYTVRPHCESERSKTSQLRSKPRCHSAAC